MGMARVAGRIGLWALLGVGSGLSVAGEPGLPARVSEADAKAVIAHRLAMRPRTDFERWMADMWLFSAASCANGAGMKAPKELDRLGIVGGAGTWAAWPRAKEAAACAAMAQGPKPACYGIKSGSDPFGGPKGGLPPDYAFLEKPMGPAGAKTRVFGYCELVEGIPETRQFWVGEGMARWIQAPSRQTIRTFQGSVEVMAGTVEFVSSAPGRHIALAIVGDTRLQAKGEGGAEPRGPGMRPPR